MIGSSFFDEQKEQTLMKILQNAIQKPDIRDRLITLFNDKDEGNAHSLEKAIAEIPGIESLKFKPQIENEEVGEERADILRPKLDLCNPRRRELMIIEELCQAIKSYGSRFTLPFRFRDATGKRTSHHLIFVSKNFRGYDIMKEIMAKESSGAEQGVPSFEYSPADFLPKQSLLFQLSRPLEDLQDRLLEAYAGQTLPMRMIYEGHSVDTPYIASNYKEALKNLENDGKITARKSDGSKRRKGTFADDVLATRDHIWRTASSGINRRLLQISRSMA